MFGLRLWRQLPAYLDLSQRLRWPATATAPVLPVSRSIRTSPRSGRSPLMCRSAYDRHRFWVKAQIHLVKLWGGHRKGAPWGPALLALNCTLASRQACEPSSTGTLGLVWPLFPAQVWGSYLKRKVAWGPALLALNCTLASRQACEPSSTWASIYT